LKDLSFKDEVTDLYNRRFFFIRLEEEISRVHRFGHPLSVVLLDLDDFKAVNDELGHTAGDDTLREVAELMVKHRQITASFGIASLPEDCLASSEALIGAADEALYAAKRDGKNSVASYELETTCAQAQQG
jgi:GGDEF domain-containing protein